MLRKVKQAFIPAVALTLAGCGVSSTDTPQSAVKSYVSAVMHNDTKSLNKVMYIGNPKKIGGEKAGEDMMDGKVLGFAQHIRAEVDRHGGLDKVKIVHMEDYGKGQKLVRFEIVCNDGKVIKSSAALGQEMVVIHTAAGWQVNPMAPA
jgi:hypothetical protein